MEPSLRVPARCCLFSEERPSGGEVGSQLAQGVGAARAARGQQETERGRRSLRDRPERRRGRDASPLRARPCQPARGRGQPHWR